VSVARPSLSPLWHKAADLRLELKPQVDVVRHVVRDTPWYVAYDRASNRSYRFSPVVYGFLMRLDGRRTVDEIWQDFAVELDEHAPSQDDILQFLGQLYLNDMLRADRAVDADELTERAGRYARRNLRQKVQNPLFLRLPLLDPDRFLTATSSAVRPLLGPVGALAWIVLVGWFVLQVGVHWEALTNDIVARVLAIDNLILILVIFPVLKAVHELAHAYATKLFGGEVHEVGVMFLVFLPVPYVDASASAAFPSKWRRIVVASAGMLAEIAIAAGAMAVWLEAEEGPVRALAFNTMLLASVSTVVFNGNPLLRFDAYYILSDLIEVPNLASRANRFWLWMVQRHVFGVPHARSPARAPGETGWFLFYAPAALAYRLLVLFGIALFVATSFFLVGVLLAIWTVLLSVVWPLAKGLHFVLFSQTLVHHRARAVFATGIGLAGVAALLFVLPLPHGTVAVGVVRLPEQAAVTLLVGGEVVAVDVADGARVSAGTPLLTLADVNLEARRALVAARLQEVRLRLRSAEAVAPGSVALYRQQADVLVAELAEVEAARAGLRPPSPATGRFHMTSDFDLLGRYAPRGKTVGHVLPDAAPVLLVAVPEEQVDLVRSATRAVAVRTAGAVFRGARPVRVLREVPGATRILPSPALARSAGGPFAVVPSSDGRERTILPFFVFEISAEDLDLGDHIGARVHARFDHGASPLGPRLFRALRQTFLRRFGV